MSALDKDSGAKLLRRVRFAEERRKILQLKEEVDACTYWHGGKDLSAALDESLHDIDSLEEKLDSKAVIAVVGGTGVGKSSLVNALCGRENTVEVGVPRPTTRKACAIVRSIGDEDAVIRSNLDRCDIDVVPVPNTLLPNAVLIDSPDTDSNECESYSTILDKVLSVADVLVCVFAATNPKRKDNLDRLRRNVAKFQPKHVAIVLNHSDGIVSDQLQDVVVPDFKEHLEKSWPGLSAHIFCTATPSKDTQSERDGFTNQLDELQAFLKSVSGTTFVDERLSRAAFIRENAENCVRTVVRQQGDWKALEEAIHGFDASVARMISDRYAKSGLDTEACTGTDLLRATAPRWWGPVGFYLGLSLRFRHFAEVPFSFSDLIPFVAIVRRMKAAFSKDESDTGKKDSDSEANRREISLSGMESQVIPEYAELAEKMVRDFGMDGSLRDHKAVLDFSELSGALYASWKTSREMEIQQSAKRCSWLWLQLLLNGVFIVATGYVGWIVMSTFLVANYLPGVFYRHGASVLFLIWLLASWIVQMRLNMESRGIPSRTERRFLEEDHYARLLAKVSDQVRRLACLASARSE